MIGELRKSIERLSDAQEIVHTNKLGAQVGRTYVAHSDKGVDMDKTRYTMISDSENTWVKSTLLHTIGGALLVTETVSTSLRAATTTRRMGELGLYLGFIDYSDEELARFGASYKGTLHTPEKATVVEEGFVQGDRALRINTNLFYGFSEQTADNAVVGLHIQVIDSYLRGDGVTAAGTYNVEGDM